MGLDNDAMEQRLFIDSFSRSLKAVLYNRNSLFLFYLSLLGIQYKWKKLNSIDHLLSAVNYQEHKWLICGDLKVVGLVPGLQGEYTKYPFFLCLWDSRADDRTRVAVKTRC